MFRKKIKDSNPAGEAPSIQKENAVLKDANDDADIFILSKELILKKEFEFVDNGYSPKEVDFFLDKIIEDYESFGRLKNHYEAIIRDTKAALEIELQKNQKVIDENNAFRSSQEDIQEKSFHNLDLIKRISRLEQVVFGKDK